MTRILRTLAMVLAIGIVVPLAHGQQRGRGEKPGAEPNKNKKEAKPESEPHNKSVGKHEPAEKPESEAKGKSPGGAWSESKKSPNRNEETEANQKSPKAAGAEGAAAESASKKNKSPSAAEGAAAESAAQKNKSPTGAEGAAAGAAAKRNQPAATGAEGAAAGAAAAKRNQPAATGAEGAAAGAAAANRNKSGANAAEAAGLAAARAPQHNEAAVAGVVGATARGAAVQNSFHHPGVYNEQWYAEHRTAWAAPNWAAGNVWTATSFAAVNSHCGYANSTPISYGYGQNVIYQQGTILMNGQNVGTAEEFSQNAANLALAGQNAETTDSDEWLPLGVFALVRDEDQHPQTTIQLAINKQGILRGNYNDIVVDHVLPLHGAVDKETQRAAWTVGNNKNFFMEAGLTNLTSGEAPTLIHKSGRTERWLLVRLTEPDEAK